MSKARTPERYNLPPEVTRRGYVKIWRSVIDWSGFKDHKLLHFWLYCLVKASHKDHESGDAWDRRKLEPGQFIFGRHKAATETGLSERTIRTCLEKLKTSRELTIQTTSRYSVITILRWNDYQTPLDANDQVNDQPPTSHRPATDQPPTTDKKVKNGKNGKKEEKDSLSEPPISDITKPPSTGKPDAISEAVAHVKTAYTIWQKEIVKSAMALWTMPSGWTTPVAETFRQRGREFIDMVTPKLLQTAKQWAGKYWAWSAVERYLDSDDARRRTTTPVVQELAPEQQARWERFQTWQHHVSSADQQRIIEAARKTEPRVETGKAMFSHWERNVERLETEAVS